jgi:hypothetical protein
MYIGIKHTHTGRYHTQAVYTRIRLPGTPKRETHVLITVGAAGYVVRQRPRVITGAMLMLLRDFGPYGICVYYHRFFLS